MNKQRRTSNLNNIVQYDASGNVTLPQIANASVDTDKFIVSDSGVIKYRTGTQVLSDIGGQGTIVLTTNDTTGPATLVGNTLNIPQYSSAPLVPQSRTISINGTSYDLTQNRSWSVGTITSLTGDVSASGTGSVSATISNAAVISKTLNGLSISGTGITQSDTILTAMGKLQNQINTLSGSLIYKGSWNALTNTPAITSGVGTSGNFYIVTVAGSTNIDGVSSWAIGDWIIFNGTVWQKVPNTNTVLSVNTYTGSVTLYTDDIAEDPSPVNLWFTNARAQAAITGGASTIVSSNLTINRALLSDASGKVSVSSVTSSELAYLSGVTSAIQTQLNGKEPSITAGTTSQYWRGDKTWQALPTFSSLSPLTTLGDTLYHDGTNNVRLAGNTTTSRRFLRQVGNGTISAAPAWDSISDSDISFSARSSNTFFAGPITGAATSPTWRVLDSADIPNNTASTTGNAGTATKLATARNINGVAFDGTAAITITSNTTNAVTFNNSGTGDASGTTFNGSTARTISYNTLGAQASSTNLSSLSGLSYSSSSFVKMTSAGTFGLDTNTYLTTTSAASTYQPIGSYVTGSASVGYFPYMSANTTTLASSGLQQINNLIKSTLNGFITPVSGGYWFGASVDGVVGISGYGTANTLVLYTNSTERIMVTPSGRVLVNTITDAGASYQFQVSGNILATAYYEGSDIRYKNVLETNPLLDLNIDVIKFKRTDVELDSVRYGYSAQQVLELLPDVVNVGDKLTLNYLDIHTIKIAALERRIKELESKLSK